jgi:hypothetical protein
VQFFEFSGFATSGKLKRQAAALVVALSLLGCSPTPETVGEMAKTSIQEVLRVDPRFKDTGIEVAAVKLTATGERMYKGTASIRHQGAVHEVPVDVLVDGLSIKWTTAPDAFSFVPQTAPPQ